MRGINHPAIVKLLAFFESPEHYFLVLERTSNVVLYGPKIVLTSIQSDGRRRTLPPDRKVDLLQRKSGTARHRSSGSRDPLST